MGRPLSLLTELADRVAALAASDPEAARRLVETLTAPVEHELGRAVLALHGRDPAAAIAHAERARELGAGAAAEPYLAAAHAMLGDHERAIASARAAVALDASTRNRGTLGSMLLAGGRTEEAAAVLRQVIADDPDDRDAHMNLATAAFQLGDHGTAMSGCARAFELEPTDRRPIHNLMAMFAEMGKWLGAAAALELSRKGAPPPEVEIALDLVMLQLVELIAREFPQPGIDADADRTIARLVANASGRAPRTQLVIARALIDVERFGDARELVDALARRYESLAPVDRGDLHYVEGLLAEHDGDAARAIDRHARALAADPRRADACVNAISLLLEEGGAEALARIGALLAQVAPAERAGNASLLFNESIYLVRADRPDEARARLEQLLRVTGGEGQVAALAREALADLTAPQ